MKYQRNNPQEEAYLIKTEHRVEGLTQHSFNKQKESRVICSTPQSGNVETNPSLKFVT
jgi:hypothetical protein